MSSPYAATAPMAHRLETVRIQLFHANVRGEKVGQRHDAMAVRLSHHRRHDAVLAPRHEGDRIEAPHRHRAFVSGERPEEKGELPPTKRARARLRSFFSESGSRCSCRRLLRAADGGEVILPSRADRSAESETRRRAIDARGLF